MASKWYMLELPDLPADGHKFKAYIDSYALTDPRGGHGSSGGSGHAAIRNIEITRVQDKYSAIFRNVAALGSGFSEMSLTVMSFENGSMVSRIVITFSDVLLESYLPQNGGFGRGPIERLTFNFAKMALGAQAS